jgi:hypothetical protein
LCLWQFSQVGKERKAQDAISLKFAKRKIVHFDARGLLTRQFCFEEQCELAGNHRKQLRVIDKTGGKRKNRQVLSAAQSGTCTIKSAAILKSSDHARARVVSIERIPVSAV